MQNLLAIMLLAMLLPMPLQAAQTGDAASDEVRNYLEVRRKRLEFAAAKSQDLKSAELFAQGLISSSEREDARSRVKLAEIDYQLSLLSLLSVSPRVSVEEAVKRASSDGRRFVAITLKNQTPAFAGSAPGLLDDAPLPKELLNRELRDVFVSIRDSGEPGVLGDEGNRGTVIAYPYETRIEVFKPEESRQLEFELLRDVNSIVVVINSKGHSQELDVRLRQASTNRAASLTSTRIFQEADLGQRAVYDLVVTRSELTQESLQLGVLGLPSEIDYSFADPQTEARLSQITFPSGVARRTLELRLFLPERSVEGGMPIDRPLTFWVIAADPSDFPAEIDRTRRPSAAELDALHAGTLELSITPRGIGRIEVDAPSLFSEVRLGEKASTLLQVRNVGSRVLDDTRIEVDSPLGWQSAIEPAVIDHLEVGRNAEVHLAFEPPADVQPGDYELRIRTKSFAYNRAVPSEDKTYRLSIQASSMSFATWGLLLGMLLLTGGVVLAGIRLARR